MTQDRDLVEEERLARLSARADDRPRPSGGGGLDSGTKKLALVAGSLGALLVLMVGGWSLLGHRPAGVPILAPPAGPVRVKPVDPGGMQLMGAQVAPSQGSNPGTQALAPGPEAASPLALQQQVAAARLADQPAPDAAPAAPAADPESGTGNVARAPLRHAPAVEAPDQPAPVAPPVPAPTPVPAPAPEAATPAAVGRYAVQLAALDSDRAARSEWSRLARKAPALFGDRTPEVLPVSRGGTQFFRLRTGGFSSIAEATGFCGKVKAAGIACTLADF